MEATGRDGGAGGPSWSYRRRHEEIESSSYTISSSSRSGTIVSSTAYTSGASRLSSGFSAMESALELDIESELRLGTPDDQQIKKPRKETGETLKEIRMNRIASMVQEFFRAPSENQQVPRTLGGGAGMSALESWFAELGVSWVLQLDVGPSASGLGRPLEGDETRIWIHALTQIMQTIHLTESFFPDHGHGFVGMPGISEEEEVESGKQAATSLDRAVQFARFFQEAMAKMLVFVDVLVSKDIGVDECSMDEWWYEPDYRSTSAFLKSCLKVNRALSEVLLGIRLQFHSSAPAEVEKIEKEMVSLLSAKQGKAFDAIRSTMEERRTRILKSMEDWLGAETPQGSTDIFIKKKGSTDIHQVTRSVMDDVRLLVYDCGEGDPLFVSQARFKKKLFVSQAARFLKYVPQTDLEEAQPFISMIAEMVSCLEEKLITKSQLFIDKGLGLLFLLNNSDYIREQLQHTHYHFGDVVRSIACKVEHYTESYIQESWEPMLSCLSNHRQPRLVRNFSPLSKFESEFQKIYTTQKLWKVPDPVLRKRLRKAVIKKIIPGYTKYIEDSKITNPKFTPQELDEKLQELFEG